MDTIEKLLISDENANVLASNKNQKTLNVLITNVSTVKCKTSIDILC